MKEMCLKFEPRPMFEDGMRYHNGRNNKKRKHKN